MLEDVFSDVRVHRTEWVVEQVRVRLSVHRSRKTDALLLSARQVDTLQNVRFNIKIEAYGACEGK